MVDLTSWTGMLAFAATTGIISAILNQVFGIWRDARVSHIKRKSESGYLALQLAALLEGYAHACASFIEKNENAPHFPEDQFPTLNTMLPELPQFPDEKDGWHSIDLKLAGRSLDLRNHLAGSQGVIDTTAEFVEDDLGDEVKMHAGKLGQEAWALAKDLRSRHGLPVFEPVWDFTDTLAIAVKGAKKAKKERADRQAESLLELAADDLRHGG
jgi:hypothetical protein